eukprot:SAG31_NODE_4887_length_2884_cov_2.240575_1_plen_248_part_00
MQNAETQGAIRLREAAERGDAEAVRLELYQGVDVDGPFGVARTALHRAADRGWVDIVRFLIVHGADVNRPTGTSGETALHLAAARDHTEIVRELLRAGADPTVKSRGNGWTALHTAMYHNNIDVARLLIRSGADPAELNMSGSTPERVAYGPDRWQRSAEDIYAGSTPSRSTSSRRSGGGGGNLTIDRTASTLSEGQARVVDVILSREEELMRTIEDRRMRRSHSRHEVRWPGQRSNLGHQLPCYDF